MGDASHATAESTSEAHPGDQHEIPVYEAHTSSNSLKDRIRLHYELASDYYYSLWGQHIHHGLFKSPNESKEEAQVNLIKLLLDISSLPEHATVLDVGCGLGGTSRYLAKHHSCTVTGITISGRQVEMARTLTLAETTSQPPTDTTSTTLEFITFPPGKVRFLELDAESMQPFFTNTPPPTPFTCIWISEALSHFPNKHNFFSSSFALLRSNSSSRLVIADWFKAPDLAPEQETADIKPIEDGMLLPRLFTMDEYVAMATHAGFEVVQDPIDISKAIARTWDISWSLISSPSLWAYAISQGRDALAFLQAFRAMRRGYANGTFRYAVMCFRKP